MAGKAPEQAKHGAIFRTIPNAVHAVTCNTSIVALDLAALIPTDGVAGPGAGGLTDLRGRWVWLSAKTADITVLRKATAPGTVGVGLLLTGGAAPQEVYIDADGTALLSALSGASAVLIIAWDSEQT